MSLHIVPKQKAIICLVLIGGMSLTWWQVRPVPEFNSICSHYYTFDASVISRVPGIHSDNDIARFPIHYWRMSFSRCSVVGLWHAACTKLCVAMAMGEVFA